MKWHLCKFVLFLCLHASNMANVRAEEVTTPSEEVAENDITDSDRNHWAYRPLKRPALPIMHQSEWVRNPIDRFILEKLEACGLEGLPAADARTLRRRASYDLAGLPPACEDIVSLPAHDIPEEFSQYVESLLQSPFYGERWAQHWLDLARFAETDGFEHDRSRADAWKYRQWVIDAFNSDVPYDKFVRQQLIGDLDNDPENDIATMFCFAGPDMPDINEQDLRRHDKLNEITSTIGPALLGLQTHCAQCHDHKYDAISAADFYRLRGIFESSVPELHRDVPFLLFQGYDQAQTPALYHRGELTQKGPTLVAKPLRIACTAGRYEAFDSNEPRQAFADWLFDPNNPLVARVIANRIWMHHFGGSLAQNSSDFGILYGDPSHPELLDWLAMELIDSGWSIKHLHRLIVNSATYRQMGSQPAEEHSDSVDFTKIEAIDPANELYSRYPRWRLEGEAIRDAMLFVCGELNLSYGGASVLPTLPPELKSTLLPGHWDESPSQADHYRRSIYVFARRNLRYPIFDAFDRPEANASCPQRNRSTTAIQSLELLNSQLSMFSSRSLVRRILSELTTAEGDPLPEMCVRRLFMICFSREPTPTELDRLTAYLENQEESYSRRLQTVCLSLINSNEFIYID